MQVKPSYHILNEFHHGTVEGYPSVTAIINESKQLQEAQELFELYQSDYIMLQRCSEELLYLKALWDMVGAVMYTFGDWYKTPWDKIDVEFLVGTGGGWEGGAGTPPGRGGMHIASMC